MEDNMTVWRTVRSLKPCDFTHTLKIDLGKLPTNTEPQF